MQQPPPLESFSETDRVLVEALRSDDPELLREITDSLPALLDDPLALEVVRVVAAPGRTEERCRLAIGLGPVLEAAHDQHGLPVAAVDPGPSEDASPSQALVDSEAASRFRSDAPLSVEGLEAVATALEGVYRDASVPEAVRRSVLEASVRAARPWHEGAVRAAWATRDEAWQLTAVFCMGHLFAVDFTREVLDAWRSSSSRLRQQALVAAGEREMRTLLPEASQTAANGSAGLDLRLTAIELLGALGGEETMELLQALAASPVRAVAGAAEKAAHWVHLRASVPPPEEDSPED